jgi:hypothetical protein
VPLALIVGDCHCGTWWICRLCGERVDMDGASPWRHVKTQHSRITT